MFLKKQKNNYFERYLDRRVMAFMAEKSDSPKPDFEINFTKNYEKNS